MKVLEGAFNQEKALVGAFSVITNLRMQLFEALVLVPHDPAGADGSVGHAALAAGGWDCSPLGGEAWPGDGAVGVHLDGDGVAAGEGAGHGGATELLAEVSVGNLDIVPPTLRVLLNIKRGKGQCGLMASYWLLPPLLQIGILELKSHF